jgi:hypothetical protein
MRAVEIGVQPRRPLPQQPRIAVPGVQQVVQQLAAHALFGLGGRASGEQEQRGDHRGALQGSLVDGVESRMPSQHQRAEQLASRHHRGDPVVPVLYGVAFGAGRLHGLGLRAARFRELDRAGKDFGHRCGHVVDSPAAQHQFGQPVVDVRGTLDHSAAVSDDLVGPAQAVESGAGLRQRVRRVDGGRGQGREGAEQRDLFPLEDPRPAVRREQHADDLGTDHQRHAENRDEPLVLHARVDGPGVLEAFVLEVVVGDIRAGGLCDESAQPLPHAQPQLLEACGDRALGDTHIGVAPGRVVQAEVRDVGAQQ